ncbi:ribosomal protein L11 methyltransferase [Clostridium moniliforme]|uniref:Ribosomal protein L11 methyltransferase n=1 Tax=Clostridium moniliforme TaxID=39489 RepID=A0ABS4EZX6_9CLOT|nr:50S ribosomal protein L11 methyltransferase [Clostridium moniliforme]MBP1889554.1 ribosomal protein L11 methyltransferase [Clostridium moniliforme]
MHILSYKVKYNEVEDIITKLQIEDIFNVFYENPLEITTDEFGYGYIEKEDEPIILKVAYDEDIINFDSFKEKVSNIIGKKEGSVEEINYEYEEFSMPAIHINDEWVLASPDEEVSDKKKINFISQGAFGTGLHETTRDLLSIILSKDFSNKRVLDIGTGSGILSLATAIKGAKEVIALDIRDVEDEVLLNASLNGIETIKVLVGDALSSEVEVNGKFDWIYINIGGEETEMFMEFIKEHLTNDGYLLVSGLVEWSFDSVKDMIESNGFTMTQKFQSAEWCTAIFK